MPPDLPALQEDYEVLGTQLARRGIEIDRLTAVAQAFRVTVPSWGLCTGGTRFARCPGPGEPHTIYENIEDAGLLFRLVRVTRDSPCTSPGTASTTRRRSPPSPTRLASASRRIW